MGKGPGLTVEEGLDTLPGKVSDPFNQRDVSLFIGIT
ncbi:hypothetical protein PRBEI_2000013900 [Prionailurus iriomotensis]